MVALERKLIYSTDEVKLAMKLLLGHRAEAETVRRNFFSGEDKKKHTNKFIPVNEDTLDWAYHVCDRMAFEPNWRIHIG
ncbi:MAG: hypothetical protein AAF530_14000 [Pseudomonadota bacterium]